MGDVTKALLLPDLTDPPLGLMQNLAIYWDEIVYPSYDGKAHLDSDDLLFEEGVVRSLPRDVPAERIFPASEDFESGEDWAYFFSRNADGDMQIHLGPDTDSDDEARSIKDYSDARLEALSAIFLEKHLGFVTDALDLAAETNLAPFSHSLGGHLAAVVGSSAEDADRADSSREAALLSVVVEAFTVDPSVSSEEILRFRSRNSKAQARLRASLVDLAGQLRTETSPTTMLAEARDTYRNRVEPALGHLEEALKESRVKFFLKSLVGATAIALAPIEPISTSAGAARVVGQSLDYSYSKSKLVGEHPYGYLHQVGEQLGIESRQPNIDELAGILKTPRASLSQMWLEDWRSVRDYYRSESGS